MATTLKGLAADLLSDSGGGAGSLMVSKRGGRDLGRFGRERPSSRREWQRHHMGGPAEGHRPREGGQHHLSRSGPTAELARQRFPGNQV
jgi:hypothetical protein